MSKEPHDTSDILHTDQSTWSGMIFNLPISDKCVEMVTPTCSNKDGLLLGYATTQSQKECIQWNDIWCCDESRKYKCIETESRWLETAVLLLLLVMFVITLHEQILACIFL